MASEVFSVPEDRLAEVIKIMRAGTEACWPELHADTIKNVLDWCDHEEEYLASLDDGVPPRRL